MACSWAKRPSSTRGRTRNWTHDVNDLHEHRYTSYDDDWIFLKQFEIFPNLSRYIFPSLCLFIFSTYHGKFSIYHSKFLSSDNVVANIAICFNDVACTNYISRCIFT